MTVGELIRGANIMTHFEVWLREGDDIDLYDEGKRDELCSETLNASVLYYSVPDTDVMDITIW